MFVKNIPVTNFDVTSADVINSIIWNAYPWRWSLSALTAITLVDGTQDYSFGGSDLASYLRLVRARITRTDTTPDEYDEILVMRWLPPDLTKSGFRSISSVAFEQSISKLRLVRAAAVPSGVTLTLNGEYQTLPTKITALSATVVFPDTHFHVALSGLLWLAYKFADDDRAGRAQASKGGGVVYTGQLGEFYDNLISMRETEEWGAGDTVFPTDPLGVSVGSYPNIFGP